MPSPTGQTILVVDDEPGLANTLRRVLEYGGYTVECVETGEHALQQLKGGRFDVVITDIFLPDVDGPQIIAATRAKQPKARIMAISGGGTYMTTPEALNVASKLGADAVLQKPFTPSELLDAVKRMLAGAN